MFRRALAKFCLPCGGETVADDVSEFDPDTVYFVPKDFHIVKARLRAQRHQEFVSRLEAFYQKMEQPAASGDVTAADLQSQLPAASLQDSQEEERPNLEEPHQEEDTLQEPQQTGPSVQESQMEDVQSPEESTRQEDVTGEVVAAPESSSEGESPPPDRRPRVCRQCWQRRAAATLRPRRRLFYPHFLH